MQGLHYKNVESIIHTTQDLVEKGNTVIAIEHNRQYISSANHIIEMGPKGGPDGGYIISEHSSSESCAYTPHFKR